MRYCDIVMKGGIASGVVYPLAAVRLAERYHFRNIGGTSAGAIAAAAVAAAERGRRSGDNPAAYDRIAALPPWLGQNMVSLFQPSRRMRPFMSLLLAASGGGRLRRIAAPLNAFPLAALVGLIPGLALIWIAATAEADTLPRAALFASAAPLLLVGALAAIAASATVRLRGLPDSYFGICPGNDLGGSASRPPLTRWLAELLDELAGKTGGEPLVFGDLWGLPEPDGEPGVTLQTITTCLTQGRPYSLPFLDEEELWFREDQFRDLFPRKVVDQMVARARGSTTGADGEPLLRLPAAADTPVVVAARMSLSFPLLIGAVPLYAPNAREGAPAGPELCWFSDGGIASNMPIHFFDSPIPRWPTFAIDLEDLPPGQEADPDPSENVWLPETNEDGIAEAWVGWRSTGKFLLSIFRTAQNWIDNRQMKGVGYRDRVAHVRLADTEGGMNLGMDAGTIELLAERGAHAADRLAERFSAGPPPGTVLTWDNQRWLRFRAYLELIERRGRLARRGYAAEDAGTPMATLNRRPPDTPPEHAWAADGQGEFAVAASEALLAAFEAWEAGGQSFGEGAPGPTGEPWSIPRI